MRNTGLTLFESLLALALAAMLLAGTVQGYAYFTQRHTLTRTLASWVNAVHFARTYALATGRTTTICPGPADNCSDGNYAAGWLVFAENEGGTVRQRDADEPVFIDASPIDSGLHLQTNLNYPLSFYADGRTNGNGHFILCLPAKYAREDARAVGVYLIHAGRLRPALGDELDGCG